MFPESTGNTAFCFFEKLGNIFEKVYFFKLKKLKLIFEYYHVMLRFSIRFWKYNDIFFLTLKKYTFLKPITNRRKREMAFFEQLGKRLTDAGQNVVQQTKNLADVTQLNSAISDR